MLGQFNVKRCCPKKFFFFAQKTYRIKQYNRKKCSFLVKQRIKKLKQNIQLIVEYFRARKRWKNLEILDILDKL